MAAVGAARDAARDERAGLETRVYVPEFADREINSPGEPGVCYQMGVGFTTGQASGKAARILADLRQRAENRNRGLLARVNAHLGPAAIDYEADVLPLTPGGNATERHMLTAYVAAFLIPNAAKTIHCLMQMDELRLIPENNSPTHHGLKKPIDHIFFYPEGRLVDYSCRIEVGDMSRRASDHLPVVADLKIK